MMQQQQLIALPHTASTNGHPLKLYEAPRIPSGTAPEIILAIIFLIVVFIVSVIVLHDALMIMIDGNLQSSIITADATKNGTACDNHHKRGMIALQS
jgi:hypothetical protein